MNGENDHEALASALIARESAFEDALDRLDNDDTDTDMDVRCLYDAIELVGVLRRLLPGRTVAELHVAFGAPGDFGYHRSAVDFAPAPEPLWGVYPRGFLEWALRLVGARPNEVLHVCSGRLPRDAGGVRVDIEARACPDVRADGRALPFRDEVFGAVLIDPPYSVEYAEGLYGTEYPRPSHLLREASRVLRPGGAIGFLHFLVPMPPPRTKLVGVPGITQGCGYRIRAFTVFRRDQATLFAVGTDR